ncbi:MAG: hypothetical protein R2710_28115 [Acidimicrobiales bacterium]
MRGIGMGSGLNSATKRVTSMVAKPPTIQRVSVDTVGWRADARLTASMIAGPSSEIDAAAEPSARPRTIQPANISPVEKRAPLRVGVLRCAGGWRR